MKCASVCCSPNRSGACVEAKEESGAGRGEAAVGSRPPMRLFERMSLVTSARFAKWNGCGREGKGRRAGRGAKQNRALVTANDTARRTTVVDQYDRQRMFGLNRCDLWLRSGVGGVQAEAERAYEVSEAAQTERRRQLQTEATADVVGQWMQLVTSARFEQRNGQGREGGQGRPSARGAKQTARWSRRGRHGNCLRSADTIESCSADCSGN